METSLNIEFVDYSKMSANIHYDVASLLAQVYNDADDEIHTKEFNLMSFYMYENGKIISYAGVVMKVINYNNQHFNIAGLTCVAVSPKHRGRKLGYNIVSKAAKWIESKNTIDFAIFTCNPSLSNFYYKAGGFEVMPNICLIGSKDEKALRSDSLKVDVLMRIYSDKASKNFNSSSKATISLELPVGYFL